MFHWRYTRHTGGGAGAYYNLFASLDSKLTHEFIRRDGTAPHPHHCISGVFLMVSWNGGVVPEVFAGFGAQGLAESVAVKTPNQGRRCRSRGAPAGALLG